MAEKQDYYSLLGISKTSSPDEMKKSYRKLAMQYHPDKNPGDKAAEQKFKEISEAYDVLTDPQKKAAYDRFGHGAFDQRNARPGAGASSSGFHGFGGSGDFTDIFGDMFEEFMSGGQGRNNARVNTRGSELRYNLQIDLE